MKKSLPQRTLSSPPKVLIAHMVGGKLTDAAGNKLHISPHCMLKQVSPGPLSKEHEEWLKQPDQQGLVRTIIASAEFVVSTRKKPWRLLTSSVPWHFVWHFLSDDPVDLVLVLYDNLGPEQEDHIIKTRVLVRGLTDGDSRRILIQSPEIWRGVGLSQERLATLLAIAPSTINYHLKRVRSKTSTANGSDLKNAKTLTPRQPPTNGAQQVQKEPTEQDQEHPAKFTPPPASTHQPSDAPIFNEQPTNGIGPDAKLEGEVLIAALTPSTTSAGDPKTVIGGEPEHRHEIPASSDDKSDCIESTTPLTPVQTTPGGEEINGPSEHDGHLRAGVGSDHQLSSRERAGGDPQPNEMGVPDANVQSPIESVVRSDRDSDAEAPSSRNGEDTNGNAPAIVQESSGPSQLTLTGIESQLPAKVDTLRPPLSRHLKQRQASGKAKN